MEHITKAEAEERLTKLEAVCKKVERYISQGGDLTSPKAAPLGVELILAAHEVAKILGYELLMPIKKKD
jgi:hypothetical protein